jgi:hypothetical protein
MNPPSGPCAAHRCPHFDPPPVQEKASEINVNPIQPVPFARFPARGAPALLKFPARGPIFLQQEINGRRRPHALPVQFDQT